MTSSPFSSLSIFSRVLIWWRSVLDRFAISYCFFSIFITFRLFIYKGRIEMLDLFNRGKGVYIKYLLRNHFYSKKTIEMDKQEDGSCVSKRKNRPLVTTIF